jgi:hypothetical protein
MLSAAENDRSKRRDLEVQPQRVLHLPSDIRLPGRAAEQ